MRFAWNAEWLELNFRDRSDYLLVDHRDFGCLLLSGVSELISLVDALTFPADEEDSTTARNRNTWTMRAVKDFSPLQYSMCGLSSFGPLFLFFHKPFFFFSILRISFRLGLLSTADGFFVFLLVKFYFAHVRCDILSLAVCDKKLIFFSSLLCRI